PELAIQFADFVRWQRRRLAGTTGERQLEYWRRRLGPRPPALELPADRPRHPRRSGRGAKLIHTLPPALSERFRALAGECRATPFMALVAAWQLLLGRWAGARDVVIGTAVSTRGRPELEGLIGPLSNNLVLRLDVGGVSFRRLVERARRMVIGAFAHQELPFERLVADLRPDRAHHHTPLFRVLFVYQQLSVEPFGERTGLQVEPLSVASTSAKFDLALSVYDRRGEWSLALEYSTEIFDATTVRRLLASYQQLLAEAVSRPDRDAGELGLLPPGQRQQLLWEWNDTDRDIPRHSTLDRLFAARARAIPGAVAVEYGDRRLTYAQLDRRANALAHRLRRLGVDHEVAVGLCFEASPELVIAMLAVVKAGGVYLPLDPGYPPRRLEMMLRDSGAPVVLVAAGSKIDFGARTADGGELRIVEVGSDEITSGCDRPPATVNAPDNLAYIIYTSGSTGRPKGVAVSHRAVIRLIANCDYVELTPTDRVGQASNVSFDAATFEVWGALLNGARLVGIERRVALSPPKLAAALADRRVSVLFLTTALFNQVAREVPDAFAGLDTLMFGGEAVDPRWVKRVIRSGPPRRLLHVYGPTETTTFATWQRLTAVAEGATTIAIGRAIGNTRSVVLDRRLRPVPIAVEGELYLGGEGLARGYFQQPAETAERFVPDPHCDRPGERLYRTGDRVRQRPDGTVEFLGRFDSQVKIRGFRIEPGEVERVLIDHPRVRQAAVLVREDEPGERRLVAYMVPDDEGSAAAELRDALAGQLPEYMVPAAIVELAALPLNPNGKVDRAALAALAPPDLGLRTPEAGWVAPRGPLEEILAEIWSELLDRSRIGAHDDFFELGGHSLMATRMVVQLHQRLGVDLDLREVFESPELAALAARLEEVLAWESRALPAIEPAADGNRWPLSFAQERLWFLDRLGGDRGSYNMPVAMRLRGQLDVAVLGSVLTELSRRHGGLRTRFATGDDGRPWQLVEPPPACFPLSVIDLGRLPAARAAAEAAAASRAEARRPFDLGRAPLFRALLSRTAAEDHTLLLNQHHIVSDGWSIEILLREIGILYRAFASGERPALPEPEIHYGDYAAWQRRWLAGEALDAQLAYWSERLRAVPELELPADRPRPTTPSLHGGRVTVTVSEARTAALEALGREAGATLFMTLLAAFQVLLYRLTGQRDVAVGTPVANRDRAELEGLIGFFVNTLVLRTDLGAAADAGGRPPSFRQLLARVREVCLGAFAHRDLPFEKLVEALRPERVLGRTPLFQAMFTFQRLSLQELIELPGLSLEPFPVDDGIARFDLTLSAFVSPRGLAVALDYSRELFDHTTARRLLGGFEHLLAEVTADPDRGIADLEMLPAAERHQLLTEQQGRAVDPERLQTLDRAFAAAARHPDAVAVACEDRQWSYRELERQVARIAHRLRRSGVGPDTPVGLELERSPEAIAALLGILAAGGVYLPLDPSHPPGRRARMLADAGAAVVMTDDGAAFEDVDNLEVLGLDDLRQLDMPAAERVATDPTPRRAELDHLAAAIYTSGSTGEPKAVMVTHRGLARTLAWRLDTFAPAPGDRVLQNIPFTFDPCLWQIFGALLSGATLVLVPPGRHQDPSYLLAEIARRGVTITDFPPSLLRQLLAREEFAACTSLRLLFAGGEALPPAVAESFRARLPAAELCNIYGPTEGSIDATCWRCRSETYGNRVPIGPAIDGKRLYVLDPNLRPVPAGVAGELYLGGGLARGYLGRPGLTADRFRPDPFATGVADQAPGEGAPGERLYRTGDLVRRRPDGALEFLGRIDHQIKLRGFRVELGEIEAALVGHPQVDEAAVVVRSESDSGEQRLVAYTSPAAVDAAALRGFLADLLPSHMIPAAFVALEEALPRMVSGKVDRAALPAPSSDAVPRPAYVAPATELERAIAGVWRQVLGVDKVGLEDNFFDLGGHSLLLVQVQQHLGEVLAREPSMVELFQYPKISALARHLGGAEREREPAAASDQERLRIEQARSRRQARRRRRSRDGTFA
ncbi:MAG: amino acid adenylation domain-containing protein, partial [Thermoanaerobaculia bacterium]